MEGNTKRYNNILREIKFLRGMKNFLIDCRNSNQYRVLVKDATGHTAYCFSTPIYNSQTKKLVCADFEKTKFGHLFKGSNGSVSICQNRCVFENREGRAIVSLKDVPSLHAENLEPKSGIVITPTLNGIRFTVNGNKISFLLKSEVKQEDIRFNSTCFSVMLEQFKPFLSIAALYAKDENGNCFPVEMKYEDKGDHTYEISLLQENKNGSFLFEINLYEPKLFHDTTVESINADVNNAYGAIGFIGKTKQFGEQWLYTRPDFSKIPDLTTKRIEKVFLHIPILNGSYENINVFVPEKRFCSFGSTWNNKVNASAKITISNNNGRYLSIDVTNMFTSNSDQTLIYNEGLILKKPKGKNDFIAISTGDCYSAPQILEIKFKN